MLVIFATTLLGSSARAQNPIVIRGRVTGPDSAPARGATVVGTSLPDSMTVRAHTDSLGIYSLRFERTSAARFVVSITALGYAPQRRMVQRPATGDSAVTLDFYLLTAAARLGPVVTRGERRKPASTDNTFTDGAGPGTTTDFVSLTNGLTGDVTGDLTAALSMIPGVTVIPDPNGGLPTISAFGLTGQNTALLNGMSFGSGSVPRDGLRLSAVTNTYDPSVGGFAGVLTSLRFPGGSNFPTRSIHYSEDDPGLQWTPQTSNQLGARYTQRVLSGTASGPIALDRVFYDVSYQAQERLNPIVSLPTVSAAAIEALGLSPDSAARLLAAVGPMGIPYRTSAIPNDSRALSGSVFSRFDFVPHPPVENSGRFPLGGPGFIFFNGANSPVDQYSLMINGGWRGQDGSGLSPTALPATGLSNRHWDARVQGNSAKYFGFVLDEATIAVSANRDHTDPYLVLPNAQILVNSALADGSGFVALQAGGSASGGSDSRSAAVEARNEISWYSWSQQHHFKIAADALLDDYSIAQAPSNGVFTFASLGDFVSGKPASFSRTLTNLATRANGLSGSLSFGDQWTSVAPGTAAPGAGVPRPWQIAYGVRLEANRLGTRPPFNSEVDSAFGLSTNHVPNTFAVLPMAGFSKSFGTFEFAPGARATRGTLSGGIREYRSSFATRGLDPYLRQTGLPSGVQQLFCVGSAAPAPDWSTFLATDSLPDDCADGSIGTPLALTSPSVAVLAPDFEPSTSWREAMSLNLALTRSFRLTMNATHARNTHQRSSFDVNFAPVVRFTLDDEAGRPVYVSPTSIDAQTGTVSYAESRVVSAFSHVSEARSDMESEARQLSTTLSYQPIIVGFNRPFWFLTGTYVLNENRDRVRGFDATTAGDPRLATWAWSATPRHVVQMNFTLAIPHWISTSLIGRLQSGVPYTPRVNSDITGTGYANAQAYVFDPASTADTVLAGGMRALLAGAPRAARDCLLSQMATIAGRNSCTPGWWSSLNVTMSPDSYRLHLGNRGRVTIILTNALAAADRVLHGANHLQGWGQPAVADPTLLTVRGFDAASNRFLYNVNPFFGSSAMYRNAFGAPFRLTLDASLQIGPDQETVSIGSYLRPRAFDNTAVLNQSQIRTRLLGNSAGGTLDVILRQRDSLKLTPQQVDSMTKLSSAYMTLRDTIYTELSKYLAARNGDYAGEEVRTRWHDALAKVFYAQNDMLQSLNAVLTPEQRRKLPIGFAARLKMTREDLAIQLRTPMISPP